MRDSSERRMIAELLAMVGGMGARETLLEWTGDADPTVRAAAWRALGVTGMDDRAAYHALRAMTDPDPRVRAHAAQALGRTGRTDFAPYLAEHLDDEWEVAAQGARALSRLGEAGVAALRAREASGAGGHGLELARHFMWEQARL
jgi:HEAT repeat protein